MLENKNVQLEYKIIYATSNDYQCTELMKGIHF